MDIGVTIVAGIGLLLLTIMTVVRLTGIGVSVRRTAFAVAELWLAMVVWVGLFIWITHLAGASHGLGSANELRELMAQLKAAPTGALVGAGLSCAAALGLFGHFMWTVSRLRGGQARP